VSRHRAWVLSLFLFFALPGLMSSGCKGSGTFVDDQPEPPTLTIDPSAPEQRIEVGETLTIQAFGEDPQGDPLTFEFEPVIDEDQLGSTLEMASFFASGNQATFIWSPDSIDVTNGEPTRLIFKLFDNKGNSAEREVRVEVLPGNGVPRFVSPASERYKECCEEPFSMIVEVRDDDSERVEISLVQGPPGSEFNQTREKRGQLRWQPAAMPEERVVRATFEADDGVNPPITQEVSILITPERMRDDEIEAIEAIDEDSGMCASDAFIAHTPLPPSRSVEPSFEITAYLTEAALERFESVYLFPAWRDPGEEGSIETPLEATEMEIVGNASKAHIPNQALVLGKDVTMMYEFCLYDDDDPTPEGLVCVPDSPLVFYTFNAYASADSPCLDDGLDQQDGGFHDDFIEDARRDLELQDTWFQFQLCPDDFDFHAFTVRPGQKIKMVLAYDTTHAEPVIGLFDADFDDVTEELGAFTCGVGYQYIELEQPLTGAPQNYYLGLQGVEGELSYFINSYELEAGRGCLDEVIEPNDRAEQATPLRVGERRSGYELCPDERDIDIFSIELNQGQKLDVTMFYNVSEADMFMDLYEPSSASNMEGDREGEFATIRSTIDEDGDHISFEARECGEHYIRVQTGQTAVPFDLLAEVSEASCVDEDEFADQCNHSPDAAAEGLIISFVERLELCGDSSDWFERYGAFADTTIELRVLEQDDASTSLLFLELWDPTGENLIAFGTTKEAGTENEHIALDYNFPDNEIYLLRVQSLRDDEISYDLELIDHGPEF